MGVPSRLLVSINTTDVERTHKKTETHKNMLTCLPRRQGLQILVWIQSINVEALAVNATTS